ncbi:tripartite tricarboxylate transporter substrate binding protein [Tardiphaga sp. vice352]|uniref:tripartite tricarboxylate transporter substrate binding protein n=1 Tax=unclassified Tardiphaga TaxID=2631404 RepID=UPI001164BE23|nr:MULTISPECIES: tripartite tricarboxylate transporter substrate binding protein [unclassified Tardiphaga]QDM18795.1 tripartite tricarboxylate transporter substrate binding protein [Tardiphaga sp. vice278]QDM23788.1 tripartite tricarboxylate transporter substrate binding protein [Tardiphaga sp. vice154]QDM29011.1 tripartite tricarboxylate transporter substrate binding protein [Tardiphaga sp. vice304]QDM34111.1 tripartite tricarboxylate transporter substrate binding protein [Tardiphaga sp. vice3
MRNLLQWSCLAAILLAPLAAHADTWPSKPIKAVNPFGAGSAGDVVPRLFFERLSAELGQPIIIENRVGAGGSIGTGAVAKSEPDGYTLLSQTNAISIAPAIFPNLAYDTSRDLASVLMIGYSANVMIVANERPWKTVQDFLAAARTKGTVIDFGSVGVGSAVHITSEKFRAAAGFHASHIPYRGGSEVITDIIGGRIDFYFCPLATALPLIREGQVRALVVSTPTRLRDLPEVPTPIEAGLTDADSSIWFGVFVPAKTPAEIIGKLYASGTKVLNTAEMQASLKKLGVEPMPMQPAELDALLVKEIAANKLLLKGEGK